MNKLMYVIGTSLVVMGLSGCGSDENIVKNGVLKYNNSITVGEAFNNWDDCKDGKWKKFETKNKIKVIEYICPKKDYVAYMNKVKSFFPSKDNSHFDVKSQTEIFQFIINKNDTFKINNVQIKTVWNDGKEYKASQNINKSLKRVYTNNKTFEVNKVSKNEAGVMSYAMTMMRNSVK